MTVSLTGLFAARHRVLLVGPPGIGKTARVHAAAAQANMATYTMRASLADRVDIGGALVPDIAAGMTRELPLHHIESLRRSDTPTVLFLDDLGQAPLDVQASCMRLFDAGYLPPHVLIAAATNRPGDKAGVTALCEPLRSRFDVAFTISIPPQPQSTVSSSDANNHVALATWQDELRAWCAWAMDAGADPAIVAWHRSTHGRTLYQWHPDADPAARYPDYRSWHSVIRLYQAGLRDTSYVASAIGLPAAVEFQAFAQLASQCPSPADILRDPDGCAVPGDPAPLWLTSTMVGGSMTPANCSAYCRYIARLPRVYGALAARDGYRRHGAALAREPAWQEWFIANQELFR